MKNFMDNLIIRKYVFCIITVTVVLILGIIVINLIANSMPEEIITSKNEENNTSDSKYYSNRNEYEYEWLNEKIKNKEYFSYEEKITNKLFVTIYNKSEYFFNGVDVYTIYYNKDKISYIEKENLYGTITPKNKFVVDLGFVPAGTTKHETIIVPSDKNEKYKDMSDFINTNIVKKNKDYFCKIENKSEQKIDDCYVQLIFYDKESNIIEIQYKWFDDIASKSTQERDLYSLRDFDHYETIINAYNYK